MISISLTGRSCQRAIHRRPHFPFAVCGRLGPHFPSKGLVLWGGCGHGTQAHAGRVMPKCRKRTHASAFVIASGIETKASIQDIPSLHLEHESPPKTTSLSAQPSSHGKSKNLANGHLSENDQMAEDVRVADAGDSEAERSNDKSVRRRQKADTDATTRSPEIMSKDDGCGSFFGMGGRRPAPRPKSVSRTGTVADVESGRLNAVLLGDTLVADGFASVRKSSSTSNLQDSSENCSSIWPTTKWNLKSDLQAISAAAITRPIFDGLPKPITGWRNKAALD